jgi:PAS domain S-box-containing protein
MLYDIDEIRRHEKEAQEAREYAEAIFNAARDPIVVLDSKLRVQRVNSAFTRMFPKTEGGVAGRLLPEIFDGQWNQSELQKLMGEIIPSGSHFEDFEIEHRHKNGGQSRLRLKCRRITESENRPALILLTVEEIA